MGDVEVTPEQRRRSVHFKNDDGQHCEELPAKSSKGDCKGIAAVGADDGSLHDRRRLSDDDKIVLEELHRKFHTEGLDDVLGNDGTRTKTFCSCYPATNHAQPSMWHFACTLCLDRVRKLRRNKSSIWDIDGIFDTCRIFEIEQEECYDLAVTIHRGTFLSKGSSFKDTLNALYPYIVLRIPHRQQNIQKHTEPKKDSINLKWDQTFHFYLYKTPREPYVLEICLMNKQFLKPDEEIDTKIFPLNCLKEGIAKTCTFNFQGVFQAFITFNIQKNEDTDLRFSMSLCDEEKAYLSQRRENVLQSMKDLLGEDGPTNVSEVPTIGILGSGGGFRAMIGLSGALRALQDTGIFDCTTYITGLSGSTWCISSLYCHDTRCYGLSCKRGQMCKEDENDNETYKRKENDVGNADFSTGAESLTNFNSKCTNIFCGCLSVKEFQKTLKVYVSHNWHWNIFKLPIYLIDLFKYWKRKQPVSPLVFIFGHLIGHALLGDEKKYILKLSDLQAQTSDGKAPFPLFAGLHGTERASNEFSEWMEFSPYEIGMGKYGTFMKTEHFGSKFFSGKLLKNFDEMPLHYLQAMWGSAFTQNLKRQLTGANSSLTEDTEKFKNKDKRREILTTKFALDTYRSGLHKDFFEKEYTDRPNTRSKPKVKEHMGYAMSDSESDNHYREYEVEGTAGRSYHTVTKQDGNNGNRNGNYSWTSLTSMVIWVFLTCCTFISWLNSKFNTLIQKSWSLLTWSFWNSRLSWSSRLTIAFWTPFTPSWLTTRILRCLNIRVVKPGGIYNPFRGLSLRYSFVQDQKGSQAGKTDELKDNEKYADGCRFQPLSQESKSIFVMDSGFAFNTPYPLLLRPQRAVDIFLSFDFSSRNHDLVVDQSTFAHLVQSEEWAKERLIPFPPIKEKIKEYLNKEIQECYVFSSSNEYFIPVVLHFPFVNNKFRSYMRPGILRSTGEELEFSKFSCFGKKSEFSTYKFQYNNKEFDQVAKLMEFNTLLHKDTIIEEIRKSIINKRLGKKLNIYQLSKILMRQTRNEKEE